jgi:organic radical activating enzyme
MENICLLLWVTSKCNLKCPLCSVKHIQILYPDYEMSIDEVKEIIESTKKRNIHYGMIQYGGGEPTQWSNLKEATKLFYESGITDAITLISNGTAPNDIFEIYPMLSCYAISATQSPPQNIELFRKSGHKVDFNFSKHKSVPLLPLPNTLPASCCNNYDYLKRLTNQIHYVNGKVYYCCYALSLGNKTEITSDLYCDFKDNFIEKFQNKKYNKQICQYCLCNGNVWSQINY